MTVLWPTVKNRLVTVLVSWDGYVASTDPAALATDVLVFDGPLVSGDDPTAFITVGWQHSTDEDSAGTFEQSEGPDGYMVTETGSVLCEIASITGDSAIPNAFVIYEALANYVQANRTLGVLDPTALTSLSCEVVQAQNSDGAVQRLLVAMEYQANAA